MKRPLFVIIAIVLGIVATNALVANKSNVADQTLEDTVETSQAAPTEVSGDIPL